MPSSPEVKPQSDATDAESERGSDHAPEREDEFGVDEQDPNAPREQEGERGEQHEHEAQEEQGGLDEVDLTDPDAWPDAPPIRKRSIAAGPDLEIVADASGDDGSVFSPRRTEIPAGEDTDARVVEDTVVEDAVIEDAVVDDGPWFDDDPAERRFRGPEQIAAAVAMLLGRVDQATIDQHRFEYAEPLIWMWRRVVGAAFAFILVSLTWYLIKVPSGLVSDGRVPTQGQVARAFHLLRTDGFAGATLSGHVGISLFRLAVGLGVGALLGVSVGLVTGAAPLVRTILEPIMSFFRSVPGLAAGPLLILWFGVGEVGLLSVVVFSVTWTVVAATADGRTDGLRTGSLDVLSVVFSGARSAFFVAWATTLAIETVMAPTGLGSMIWFAQGRSDLMVAGIVIAGLIGFVLDTLLRIAHYLIVTSGMMAHVSPTAEPDVAGGGSADDGHQNQAWEVGVADPLDVSGSSHSHPLT